MMNVVIYARFSSHSQTEQSIEGQLKVCYEFAKRNDYNVIGEYIDRAISGKDAEKRPDSQRMIADSAKRQFNAILVYQLDRFSRNRYDSAIYKAKLRKYGVRVLSAKENISDDASGVLMESVLEGMAEYYSVELAQKIRRGMQINAEKCLAVGGMKILGYKIQEKKYAIDTDEAPIVKKIFQMYIEGSKMAEIIRYLNNNGVKTALGNDFNKSSIRRILTNKKYIGIYSYNGKETPGGVPRIIDDDTFRQAQEILQKNKKAPARKKCIEENYLLSTKISCGYCNKNIFGVSGISHTGKFYQYYQCSENRKKKCDLKPIRKEIIENLVIKTVFSILTDEKIDEISKRVCKLSERESNTDTLKRLKKLIKENEQATANLIKALETGKAVDIISAQIEKRQIEKQNLEAELAKEKILNPKLEFAQVKFFFDRFKNGNVNDMKFCQYMVDTFINRVFLFKEKLLILCNACDRAINIPLDFSHPEGSYWVNLSNHSNFDTKYQYFLNTCNYISSFTVLSKKDLKFFY